MGTVFGPYVFCLEAGSPPRPIVPEGLKVGDAQRRKLAHNGGDLQRTANGAAEPIKSPFQRPLLKPSSNPELVFEVQLYRGSGGQTLVDLQVRNCKCFFLPTSVPLSASQGMPQHAHMAPWEGYAQL
jgi:hypothetical protein